ncbi:MAG: hypothetical protein WCO62_00280 [Betaproteobacteria bacterium]
MTTQKFMGRHQLLQRLTAQVGGNEQMAKDILIKRGQMTSDGELTTAGRARDSMTAEERAKDRASKASGKPPSVFTYHAKTNTAVARKKK